MAGIGGYLGNQGLGWYNDGQLDAYDPRTKWTPYDLAADQEQASRSETGQLAGNASPGLSEAYWRGLGYQGPIETGGSSDAYQSGMAPELAAWRDAQGWTPANTEGYGGFLDKNGKIVPNSAFGNSNNDDATFIAGILGLGGAGYAAGMFGGAGAAAEPAVGTAAGTTAGVGSTTAEQIALMQANGMTASEIAAATGGQAAGYTAGEVAAMNAAGGAGGVSAATTTTPTASNSLGDSLSNGAKSVGEWALKNPTQAIQVAGIVGGALKDKNGNSTSGGPSSGGIGGMGSQSSMTATPAAALNRQYIAPPAGYRPGFDPEHKYFTGIGAVGAGAAGVPANSPKKDDIMYTQPAFPANSLKKDDVMYTQPAFPANRG